MMVNHHVAHHPLIVLGGGLTGLSAAYHHPGAIVYERESVPIGHGKSHVVNQFIFDEGIHVVHTTDPEVLALYEDLGVRFSVRQRKAWIQSHGARTRYPFQANTYGLPVSIVKDCLVGFVQNDFRDRTAIANYEDWLHCIFGKGIAEHFMIPYAQKFWGVHPRELMTDWVDVRHPRPSLEEVVEGALHDQTKGFGVNAEFRYPVRGGFGAIGQAFVVKVGDRLRTGMEVTALDVHAKTVTFNGRETVPYDRIVSTIPLPDIVRCIADAPPEVRAAAARLHTNSFFVVNVALNRPEETDAHWIYYLEREFPFVRLSFLANFGDDVVPAGTSAIQAEVAYHRDTNPLAGSREDVVRSVLECLKALRFIRSDREVLFTNTLDIPYAYIVHDRDRAPSVRVIHDFLHAHDIYPCGRYGDWGYLWSHDAILRGRNMAQALVRGELPHGASVSDTRTGCGCVGEFMA
ncbi:MAG: FAD-dependent oxidoreductase [bacterium]|nr:FAD-dependent oxidoreductase [bacterium]